MQGIRIFIVLLVSVYAMGYYNDKSHSPENDKPTVTIAESQGFF